MSSHPTIQIFLIGPKQQIAIEAIVDTGASISAASRGILIDLGLKPISRAAVHTFDRIIEAEIYHVTVEFREERYMVPFVGLPHLPVAILGRNFLEMHPEALLQVFPRLRRVKRPRVSVRVENLRESPLESFRVAIQQIDLPSSWIDPKTMRIRRSRLTNHLQKVLRALDIAIKEKCKVIIFPELTGDPTIMSKIQASASTSDVIIIGGTYYDNNLRNVCPIAFPGGNLYEQTKVGRSPYDHPRMKPGSTILLFKNTVLGDFAVAICIDFLNLGLLQSLARKVDLLFTPAYNASVATFHSFAITQSYYLYCYSIICNTSAYGSSGCYGPLRGGKKVICRLVGQVEGSIFVDLDIDSLRRARRGEDISPYKKPLPLV